jgi:glycosyltransferase involved in cell wall biosynthesis
MASPAVVDPQRTTAHRLLQSGAYQEAIQLLDALLKKQPDDPDLLNDAALAHNQHGEPAKAEKYLRRALGIQPDHEPAFYNLLDVLIKRYDNVAAQEAFTMYSSEVPDSGEKARYSERLDDSSLSHKGDGSPAEVCDTDTLRIAFVCGPDRKFISDIEREIRARHEVRTAYFGKEVNLEQIQQVMDWADVTWFEWAYKILMHASNRLNKTCHVVTRMHRWEAFQRELAHINWSFVDVLIPTTHHILETVKDQVPAIRNVDTEVISSTVDLKKYRFKLRRPGHDVAYVGFVNYRKNPSLLLQCIKALVKRDKRYKLHIAGDFQDKELEQYFENMLDVLKVRDHVSMYGWVDDIADWLEDKNYLVLPTTHEGNPYCVLEAASMGIKPVVHCFPGSDALYPPGWTFGEIDEFVERVVSNDYDSDSYRSYVAQEYSLSQTIERIDELLVGLSEMPTPKSDESCVASSPSLTTPNFTKAEGTKYHENDAYVVLGMHRSGTSLTTQLLHCAGVFTGLQDDHLSPSKYNPRGYWELKSLVKLNRALLHLASGDSYNPPPIESIQNVEGQPRIEDVLSYFDGYKKWGIKDPRLCLTFPLFAPYLPESTKLIWVKRDPESIAQSLRNRDGIPPESGIKLTHKYWQRVESYTNNFPTLNLNFENLIDPKRRNKSIEKLLDFTGADKSMSASLLRVVDPTLQHH